MCAVRALREEDAVAWTELLLALRRPERGPAGYDDEQLVVSDLVVVLPGPFARRQLVQARAESLACDAHPAPAEPRPVVLARPLVAEEIDAQRTLSRRVPRHGGDATARSSATSPARRRARPFSGCGSRARRCCRRDRGRTRRSSPRGRQGARRGCRSTDTPPRHRPGGTP